MDCINESELGLVPLALGSFLGCIPQVKYVIRVMYRIIIEENVLGRIKRISRIYTKI